MMKLPFVRRNAIGTPHLHRCCGSRAGVTIIWRRWMIKMPIVVKESPTTGLKRGLKRYEILIRITATA